MSDILYIQTEKNVEVHSPEVYVQDVASLSCSNGKVLNRNKARKLFTIPDEKPGRYVISAMEIVDLIQRNEESVDVTHIGEANFILTYETQKHAHQFYSWLKTIFVSLVTFFGGAFSIMTFNTDVDTAGLFTKVYEQITGRVSNGKTILELSYSIGIRLGVIFFFNHFGGRKITEDPTPMEVEMRVYEDDVNKTLIEQEKRKERK